MYICGLYIPSIRSSEYYDRVTSSLNLPYIEWMSDYELYKNVLFPVNVIAESTFNLLQTLSNNALYQVNNIPNSQQKFLDLVK